MGWGDELLAAGEVERRGVRCRIAGAGNSHRWNEIWEGNPLIARPGEPCEAVVVNGPHDRPYIAEKGVRQWVWKPYAPHPARVYFTPGELAQAPRGEGRIVIEPNLKPRASPNKDWGWGRYQALVNARPDWPWAQLGPAGTACLRGVEFIETRSFREALAVLSRAQAYVGHEGGLHHGAAAVGIPAVVIFGGFISPAQTGYAMHRNLFTGGTPCGMRTPCDHCRKAMALIDPAWVLAELEAAIEKSRGRVAA